jgi:serine/threonine-protein kinase RsbW
VTADTTAAADAGTDVLQIPATTDALPRLVDFVAGLARRTGLSDRMRNRLRLAAEEIVVNVGRHASPIDNPAWVTLAGGTNGDSVWLRITDAAPPFDPTAPPAGGPQQVWSEGGVGLILARNMVDRICYRRVDGQNETTLLLRADPR